MEKKDDYVRVEYQSSILGVSQVTRMSNVVDKYGTSFVWYLWNFSYSCSLLMMLSFGFHRAEIR